MWNVFEKLERGDGIDLKRVKTASQNSFLILPSPKLYNQSSLEKGIAPMAESEKEKLIRQYAAGEITWHSLRERGFENYVQVLGALGELGLRPPIAPMEGPNRAARERGRALIREALREASRAHP
ncbi:MAG: hypothetical protein ACLQIQ_18580 [Beijerinckiaceae bacterium]